MKLKAVSATMLTLFVVSIAFNVVPVLGATQYIKIGVVGPQGLIQWDGLWEGAQMARDEINDAGGINIGGVSYTIQLVDIDEGLLDVPRPSDPVTELLTTLEDNPDMQFLIGGFRTECVQPMREVAMDYAAVNGRPIWFICGAATDELIDCGNGTCGSCVRCDYDRYKYMFRVSPVNATTLLNTLVVFLKDHVLPQELVPLYGSPVKTYIVAEKLVWCDGVVASLQSGALGTQAEIVGVNRPSANETFFGPLLETIENSGSKLIIHMFSAVAGMHFIEQWGDIEVLAVPVGINFESMRRSRLVHDWEWTGEEYESILHCVGTRTNINPDAKPLSTEAFWDEYSTKYAHDPTYPAWGAYDAIIALNDTLYGMPTLPNCTTLIPLIEQTNRTGILGRFKYTEYHDVFCNEIGSTWTQGYVRPLVVQWQADEMKVVWPRDQLYSVLWVIPEFPAAIILPLFMFLTLIAVVLAKKIRRKVIANTT